MSIKNIFKATSITFSKYSKYILSFSFASSIILFGIYFLLNVIGGGIFSLFFVFVIIIPLLFSFKYISLMAVDRLDIYPKSFYIGFKNYFASLSIMSKTVVSTILSLFLGSLVGLLFGSLLLSFKVLSTNPTLISQFATNLNSEEFFEAISKLSYYETYSFITSVLAIIFAIISFMFFGTNNVFAPLINFDTHFTTFSASKLSIKYSKENKNSLNKFNFIYLIFELIIIGLVIGLNRVLVYINVNENMIKLFTGLLFFVLNGIYIPIYEISISHIYVHYFRSKVKLKDDEYMSKLKDNNLI